MDALYSSKSIDCFAFVPDMILPALETMDIKILHVITDLIKIFDQLTICHGFTPLPVLYYYAPSRFSMILP